MGKEHLTFRPVGSEALRQHRVSGECRELHVAVWANNCHSQPITNPSAAQGQGKAAQRRSTTFDRRSNHRARQPKRVVKRTSFADPSTPSPRFEIISQHPRDDSSALGGVTACQQLSPSPPGNRSTGSVGYVRDTESGHLYNRPGPHSCMKSLRDGHKEWKLPPDRYRLANNLSDLASKSTGTKGPYQCFTGERFENLLPVPSGSANQSKNRNHHLLHIPAEMDRLNHPRQYFVGKIRPGDKNKQRPCSRLAISQPTHCWRNPRDPAPNQYFKGILDSPTGKSTDRRRRSPVKNFLREATVHHSYCREPFTRPGSGRYDLMTGMPPPVPPRVAKPIREKTRENFSYNFAWNPHRQPDHLLMHTVNIPIRRRRRGRNMKVAFGSGSARFKGQAYIPIGAMTTAISSVRKDSSTGSEIPSPLGGGARAKEVPGAEDEEDKTDLLIDLRKTPTKYFIIPKRGHQRRLSQIVDLQRTSGVAETTKRSSSTRISRIILPDEIALPTIEESPVQDQEEQIEIIEELPVSVTEPAGEVLNNDNSEDVAEPPMSEQPDQVEQVEKEIEAPETVEEQPHQDEPAKIESAEKLPSSENEPTNES
ncbi:uncharacterized protein LOC129753851 [Uranotaenia lowii]|uniref:uncharacterized protein LOC129753851 n=1 Tax=Uranotaenia lowii TaxID=190385 RepID=UPI00247AB193|nr:uncharacterized protein LOC129753851 [Uranotaenia lowii]